MDILRNLDIGTIAIQFAVLLFSLSIHEASHAWMADRLGDYSARYLGRVTINPVPHIDPVGTILFPLIQLIFPNFLLIGWAKPVPINPIHLKNPQRDQVFISLAGPASNFLASGIAFSLLLVLKVSSEQVRGFIDYGLMPGGSILAPVLMIIYFAMMLNLVLAIFNLIPIPPLDGHWILYGLLPGKASATLEKMAPYGFIILYALMFLGVFRIILSPIVSILIALLRAF